MAERVSAVRRRRQPSPLGLWLGPLLLLLPIGWFYGTRLPPARAARTRSASFRRYLASSGSRLVVYTPDASLQGRDRQETVARQLAKLREKFDGLVLYQSDEQTAALLKTAAALHYRAVLLTVWDPASADEVRRAAKLVDDYGGSMAVAVSVGSEGLMEGRYTVHDLQVAEADLERRTRGDEAVETTTTEPWWMYTRKTAEAASLRGFGDFASVNVHVIWDTDIADPVEAANWTADRAIEVQQQLGKPLLVREAGFPGGGQSPRKTARFGFTRAMQVEFWSAWQRRYRSGHGAPMAAAFEGVDNPAKQWDGFESTWGFLSLDLKPYAVWDALPELVAGPSEMRPQ